MMIASLFRKRVKFYSWKNPDGSIGGDVSAQAKVHPTATIEKYATVLSGAVVGAGQTISSGTIVQADGDRFRFGDGRENRVSKSLRRRR